MSVYGKVVSAQGSNTKSVAAARKKDDDEWDTDPDFVNEMSEKQQRKGQAPRNAVNVEEIRNQAKQQHEAVSKQEFEKSATRYGVQVKDDEKLRATMGKSAVAVDVPKPVRTQPVAPVVPTSAERQKFWDEQNKDVQKKSSGPQNQAVVPQGAGASAKKNIFEQQAAAPQEKPQVQGTGKKWTPPPKAAAPAPAAKPTPAGGAPKWRPPGGSGPPTPAGGPPMKSAPPVPAGGPPKAGPPPVPAGGPPRGAPPAEDDWGSAPPANEPPPEPAHEDWGQPAEPAYHEEPPAEAPHDDWGHQEEAAAPQDDWGSPPAESAPPEEPPAHDDEWGHQAEAADEPPPAQHDEGFGHQEEAQHEQGGGEGGGGGSEFPQVKALYDFAGETPDDLSFHAGDVFFILDDSDPSGWWRGQDMQGNVGLFPMNLVERI